MLKVGITGNIGSGKTTVSKIFEVLGIPVFYADEQAKNVMVADEVLVNGIKETFGSEAYFTDGALNRKYIANIVFNNDAELAKLNALVHPAVFRAFDAWATRYKNVPYVLKEAALLFESSSYKMCDKTIMVTAPLEMRLERVTRRDNLSSEDVLKREAYQFTEDKKIPLADYVITNNNQQAVIPQVLKLHEVFSAQHSK